MKRAFVGNIILQFTHSNNTINSKPHRGANNDGNNQAYVARNDCLSHDKREEDVCRHHNGIESFVLTL